VDSLGAIGLRGRATPLSRGQQLVGWRSARAGLESLRDTSTQVPRQRPDSSSVEQLRGPLEGNGDQPQILPSNILVTSDRYSLDLAVHGAVTALRVVR
jgi:hypothetical protein